MSERIQAPIDRDHERSPDPLPPAVPTFGADVAQVLAAAQRAVREPPPCILDRDPSGHGLRARAYYSVGKYAWPNPDTEDGLPYRRIDCAINPAATSNAYDWARLARLVRECRTLVLAGVLEPDPRWFAALESRLDTWFVNPQTAMEPHLEHAAALPGVNDGMWVGIIEGACLISLVHDLQALLARRIEMPPSLLATLAAVREWFARFATWYRTSEKGAQDSAATNNHGLWYHLQLYTWTSFGSPEASTFALAALRGRLVDVVAAQIGSDGELPHELRRENALGYVVFTLLGVAAVTEEVERAGVDLLQRRAPSGAPIARSFTWLAQNADSLPGGHESGEIAGRGAVLAGWMADRFPDEPAVLALARQWGPSATAHQRVRKAIGLRSWR